MKTVSVAHIKGGVGKTTTAVNIAYHAAQSGLRTLLVDMDAQAAASFLLRAAPESRARGKQIAAARKSLRDDIVETEYSGLDVLPASLSFRKLPVLLAERGHGQVESALRRLGKGYDLVVVDAPAGLNYESEEIIRASDLILVPVIPSALGVTSYETFFAFAATRTKKRKVRGFVSMADTRRSVHKRYISQLSGMKSCLDVCVPYSAAVERMATERVPLALIKRPGKAGSASRELWSQVQGQLYGSRT